MANHAIIRIEKCKLGAVGRINGHHERLKEQYKSNPDIDPTRSKENYHLIGPPRRYRDAVLQRIEAAGAKRRKDSVVMQDGLITASPEWYKSKEPAEISDYFTYALEFVKERYGRENIISAVVHMDESNPHMHFCFVPITKDGRLSSKDIMGGPKGMQQLQDDFFKYANSRYPEFSRGLPVRLTHRTHLPTYLYKNAQDLYAHYGEICKAIQDIGVFGSAKKKDEAIALLGRYAPEMAKMEQQLKTTEKQMNRLKSDLEDKDSDISRYRRANRSQEEQIDSLYESITELERKQKELQDQIKLVPQQLMQQLVEKENRRRAEERKARSKGDRCL